MPSYILTPSEARQKITDRSVFSFDIETETAAPHVGWGTKFGLSYASHPTWFSAYFSDSQTVVFDMDQTLDDYGEKVVFIRQLFLQDDYLAIAHNASFDLRMLGGHYDFTLPMGARVWDTQVMGVRLLVADASRTSLKLMLARWGLYSEEGEFTVALKSGEENHYKGEAAFLAVMKPYRAKLHLLESQTLLDYVALDSITTYRLYVEQEKAARQMARGHYQKEFAQFDQIRIPHWPELYGEGDATFDFDKWGLIRWELAVSRWSANAAIRGVKLDVDYAEKRMGEWAREREDEMAKVLAYADLNVDYAAEQTLGHFCWWDGAILRFLRSEVANFKNQFLCEGFHYLSGLTAEEVEPFLVFDSDVITQLGNEAMLVLRRTWAEWLVEIPEFTAEKMKKGETEKVLVNRKWIVEHALKMKGEPIPRIDLDGVAKWVFELNDDYLAKLAKNWIIFNTNQRYRIQPNERVAKDHWLPYFVFVVCKIPLPTHLEILFAPNSKSVNGVVTPAATAFIMDSIWQKTAAHMRDQQESEIRAYYDDDYSWASRHPQRNGEPWLVEFDGESNHWVRPLEGKLDALSAELGRLEYSQWVDFQDIAKLKGFSISVHSLKIMVPDQKAGEEYPDNKLAIKALEHCLQAAAYTQRGKELLLHAERDGRIHSIISRHARTSRFRASSPNPQNVAMSKFSGWLVGDDGYTLIEFDLNGAELKWRGVIAGDDASALATEGSDYHSVAAAAYYGEAYEKANKKGRKELRSAGKVVTFGTDYTMKAQTLHRKLGSVEKPVWIGEAEDLIAGKELWLARTTQRVQETVNYIKARYAEGWVPFVKLWSGTRVGIKVFRNKSTGRWMPAAKDGWNGKIQGAVGEHIARSLVVVDHYLTTNGFNSRVDLNVHDALQPNVYNEEYPVVGPAICRIMAEIPPMQFCRRTIPTINFTTQAGPENAQKWGKRDGQPYPLSMDHWVNQWGYMVLPEEELTKPPEEREAPNWFGPVHEGWTLEKAIDQRHAEESTRG